LKSSSANLGAMTLSNLASNLENRVKTGEMADVLQQVKLLEAEFEGVRNVLKGYLG
ncbi:MAG: Hpt domain-containing protein, partial [Gammaproteobacteria bacterium]|nr:Hpt domain-containing protein [Gammaproteobacteria bacterium]